jgi:hypothetical protein
MAKKIIGFWATLVLLLTGLGQGAFSAGAGVGDVSDAVRYGATAPLGVALSGSSPSLSDDDDSELYALPFPINFFGTKATHICISTNGAVFPTVSGASCSDKYDYDLELLAINASQDIIAVMAKDVDPGECEDTSNDGFGVPCEIYYDTSLTVGGAEAIAITWYRVPTNDDNNDPDLDDTFQLVIYKSGTGDSTSGFDFDAEFNYGHVTDNDDGYSAADPNSDCDASDDITDCRWGVGWADYDAGGTTAFELFAATEINDLIDSSSTKALSKNSLNSSVAGRYVFGQVNGVTVNFSVPVLNGGAPAAPAPYTGPLLTGFSSRTLDVCDAKSITLTGLRLAGVTSASVQGQAATISSSSATQLSLIFPAGLTPGQDVDLVINSSSGTLTHQDAFDIPAAMCSSSAGIGYWTKLQNDLGSAKFYAKNIVGAGKVQFMLNGEEIAWVRATSAADAKLRSANGASYLVRTVDLVEGQKNVLEIYVDGVRTTRTAYTY